MNKQIIIAYDSTHSVAVNTFFDIFNIKRVFSLHVLLFPNQFSSNGTFNYNSNEAAKKGLLKKSSKSMKIKDVLNKFESQKSNYVISMDCVDFMNDSK
jgi:predicted transcriptional regulator